MSDRHALAAPLANVPSVNYISTYLQQLRERSAQAAAAAGPVPERPGAEAAEATHGGPDEHGQPAHDFSTNGNACGPCPAALKAVRTTDASTYPDPRYAELRHRLARLHEVPAERIVFAASASEFIFRFTAAMAQRGHGRVMVPTHAYGDYERAARAWDLPVARHDAPPGDTRLVWYCEPASPLGEVDDRIDERIDALDRQAECVIDLAYAPLRLSGTMRWSSAQRDRVWQLWTPNKALGMTGIRAAYAVAPRHSQALVERVVRLAPSWPIGAHGLAMLHCWTEDASCQWLANSQVILRIWKQEQIALCQSMGWDVLPSHANFFCARPPVDDVVGLCMQMRREGVKLRHAASFGLPGLVRLAVLPPASQEALRTAWEKVSGRSV